MGLCCSHRSQKEMTHIYTAPSLGRSKIRERVPFVSFAIRFANPCACGPGDAHSPAAGYPGRHCTYARAAPPRRLCWGLSPGCSCSWTGRRGPALRAESTQGARNGPHEGHSQTLGAFRFRVAIYRAAGPRPGGAQELTAARISVNTARIYISRCTATCMHILYSWASVVQQFRCTQYSHVYLTWLSNLLRWDLVGAVVY